MTIEAKRLGNEGQAEQARAVFQTIEDGLGEERDQLIGSAEGVFQFMLAVVSSKDVQEILFKNRGRRLNLGIADLSIGAHEIGTYRHSRLAIGVFDSNEVVEDVKKDIAPYALNHYSRYWLATNTNWNEERREGDISRIMEQFGRQSQVTILRNFQAQVREWRPQSVSKT